MDTLEPIIFLEEPSKKYSWLRRLFHKGRADIAFAPQGISDAQCMFTSLQETNSVFKLEAPNSDAHTPSLIYGYLLILSILALSPLATWAIVSWREPNRFMEGMREVQNYTTTLISSLSGISGLLGFIIGRYYRSKNISEIQ